VNIDYHILITDENGCSKEYILPITVNKSGDLYFPNTFSPNGDGVNDHFYPFSKNSNPILYFAIYDRWGEQIFLAKDIHSNQEAQGWNGKFNDQDVIPGVYIYIIEYLNSEGNITKKNGDINVIR
jgi:gliding motility-associated-like protein